MHQNVIAGAVGSLLVLACSSSDAPNRAQRAVNASAPLTNAPVPPVAVHNGAPLNNAAGYREQARNSSPDTRVGALAAGSERTARGTLVPLQGRRIHGEVRLEEVADSVRVEIAVESGQPGTRRVALRPGADCKALRRAPWKSPPQFAPGIGALSVGPDGHAKTTLTMEGANLRPDSSGSLLGSVVLLYAAERIAAETRAPELPIACADIAS